MPLDAAVLRELRQFFRGGPAPGLSRPDGTLIPALFHAFRNPERIRTDFPLYLPPVQGASGEPLCVPITEFLEQGLPTAAQSRILRENVLRIERHVRELMAGQPGPAPARLILESAGTAALRELKLKDEEAATTESDLRDFLGRIPEGARLLPLNDEVPIHLLEQALGHATYPAREAMVARIRDIAYRLRSYLQADRLKRPEARDGSALAGSVGDVSSRFMNSGALAGLVGAARSGKVLPEDRRVRLEKALTALESLPAEGERAHLLHDGSLSDDAAARLKGWRVKLRRDPCAEATTLFDHEAGRLADVLRAARLAELELDGTYDPAVHGPWLDQLDWEGFTREELQLITPVVVHITEDLVLGQGMLSLSRLILSGRPVQILVTVMPAGNPGAESPRDILSGYRFEPAYLGVSHREVVVQQTAPARPVHMMQGFVRGLNATHAAMHVIASTTALDGEESEFGAWLLNGAALEGRAHPLFHYDPGQGATWARRIEFGENPAPGDDWPVHQLAVRGPAGEETLECAFTFADFVLLEPSYGEHFRVIPEGRGSEDLVPLGDYLLLEGVELERRVPFVYAVDARGHLLRVAVSRQLVLACRDRLDFWRTLQELAGVRNAYVEAARDAIHEEADKRVREEVEALRRSHAEELDRIRRDASEDVVQRLTAALLEVDLSMVAPPPGAAGTLARMAGRNVDDVARELLKAVDPATLEADFKNVPGGAADELASRLMGMIDPKILDEETK